MADVIQTIAFQYQLPKTSLMVDSDVNLTAEKVSIHLQFEGVRIHQQKDQEILIRDLVALEYRTRNSLKLTFHYPGPGEDAIMIHGTPEDLARFCENIERLKPAVSIDRAGIDDSAPKEIRKLMIGYLIFLGTLVLLTIGTIYFIRIVASLAGYKSPL